MGAAKAIRDHARSKVKLQLQHQASELKEKLQPLGLGIGLLACSAVVGVFALGFVLATIAAALAIVLATWLALLAMTAVLLLVAGLLAALGVRRLRRPAPATRP
jgi:putative superfamily III holin-X